ncbi:hypothetical protein Tco_1368018 [Tanacetum coccineum]
MLEGNISGNKELQDEFDNKIWPDLKSKVDVLLEVGIYPSKAVRMDWTIHQMDYFYKNRYKYKLDPVCEDYDDVESETNGIASEIKPKYSLDVAGCMGISDFIDCVADIKVEDLAHSGMNFTWNKSPRKVGGLLKKLDQVMCNIHFLTAFPSSYAYFLPFMTSDHTLVVFVILKVNRAKPKPFKFQNYLTGKEGFIPIVKKYWDAKVEGYSMFSLVSKLKMLKKPLRKLNFEQGNLFDNVKNLRKELSCIQIAMEADPHSISLREAELICLKAYNDSPISIVEDMSGVPYFGPDLSMNNAEYMIRDISDDEVKLALFDIDGNKAPARMGFPLNFLRLHGMLLLRTFAKLQISDNILLPQELMRGYHRNRGYSKCAFKVDIQKAYDTIEWKFLKDCLNNLMLLCDGDSSSVAVLKKALDEFEGKLPIRYLGVPLISKRLYVKDFLPLIDKVRKRVDD